MECAAHRPSSSPARISTSWPPRSTSSITAQGVETEAERDEATQAAEVVLLSEAGAPQVAGTDKGSTTFDAVSAENEAPLRTQMEPPVAPVTEGREAEGEDQARADLRRPPR